MKKLVYSLMICGLYAPFVTNSAYADVLTMPEAPEAADASNSDTESMSITLPGRGMTKENVETRFGAPDTITSSVGEPPISRWIYGSFTVYFEYDHVIHSVLHRN